MKNEEISEPTYDDFEPYCEWKKEVGASVIKEIDILEIQLHGFKEEELKNEMKKDGFLYVSGEHPMMNNKIKRFKKKIDVSKYEIKEIEAKFEAGKLHLRLPCKSSAISFLSTGSGERVGILRLDNTCLSSAMAVALVLLLAFYVYKYSQSQCTIFYSNPK